MSRRSIGTSAVTVATALACVAAASPASAHASTTTKAKAKAVAAHVNLHSSDLPGYSVQQYKPSAAADKVQQTYAKCVGTAPQLVNVESNAFTNSGGYGFTSSTAFVASRSAAKRDAKRIASAHGRQCLKQTFESAATGAGASSATVTITPVAESAQSGLAAIDAFKITASFKIFGYSATLHGYEVGFVRGNAEVELDEIGTADKPQSITDAPLAALVQRAEKKVPAAGLTIKHG